MFGGIANSDHDECIRIIHRALDFGINVVDTADRYSNGESEEIVGKALNGRSQNVVLATKVNGAMVYPNQQGNSRRWITQAVEASLRRLQTDHIDLYQIHRPSPDTAEQAGLSLTHMAMAFVMANRVSHPPSWVLARCNSWMTYLPAPESRLARKSSTRSTKSLCREPTRGRWARSILRPQ